MVPLAVATGLVQPGFASYTGLPATACFRLLQNLCDLSVCYNIRISPLGGGLDADQPFVTDLYVLRPLFPSPKLVKHPTAKMVGLTKRFHGEAKAIHRGFSTCSATLGNS
jgi:hypothetical protein